MKQHRNVNRWFRGAAFFAIVTATAGPAFAQSEAPQEDEAFGEITVTAQRREQRLQDVGVSVTALGSEDLRSQGVVDSKDIARIAPGVVFDSTAGGGINANLTVRGVSQSDFSSNQESPNSIYVDEVYLSSPNAAAFTFYDLDRVEVLRGPQGTLFGRASSGGLASFISKRPSDSFEGYLEAGYGRFNSAYLEGAVSGPLSDTFRVRLSGRASRADGWFQNTLAGNRDTFEDRFWGLRGQIEADLTPDFEARLSVSFDKTPRSRQGVYKPENFYVDGSGQPAPLPANVDAYGTGPGNDFNGYRDTNPDGQSGAFNDFGFLTNQRFMSSLYLTYSGDGYTVSSISNLTNFKFDYSEDCDGTPVDYCQFPFGQKLDQYSQELRINGEAGNLNYTAGAYYLNIKQTGFINFVFPALAGSDFSFDSSNTFAQKLESYALFGQLEYALSDKLSATVGIRWTHDNKRITSQTVFNELGNGYSGGTGTVVYTPPLLAYDFSPAAVGALARHSADLWSGKFQLDYKPVDDVLLYASVSRGAKGPGFNTNVGGALLISETPFGSENLWAYEGGFKTRILDRRVTFNGSIFYYDYNDFQGFAFSGLQGLIANYDARFYGGEVELAARLPGDFEAKLGAAYLKSKVFDVPTIYSGLQDQESIMAPRWTVSGNLSKDFDVGSGTLNFNWSFDYISDRYASIDNSEATKIEGSFVHNARVTYKLPDNGLEFAAFVNNISNVDRENFAYDILATTGSVIKSYAKPRWWGISVRKEF